MKAEVALLKWDKVDLRIRTIARIKEKHLIQIKGLSHQKDVTILNITVQSSKDSNYMKQNQIELKGEIDKNHISTKWLQHSFTIDRINGERTN